MTDQNVPDPRTEWGAANANVLEIIAKADAEPEEIAEAWERFDRAADMLQRKYRPGINA